MVPSSRSMPGNFSTSSFANPAPITARPSRLYVALVGMQRMSAENVQISPVASRTSTSHDIFVKTFSDFTMMFLPTPYDVLCQLLQDRVIITVNIATVRLQVEQLLKLVVVVRLV